ncbi:MAG: hypothetical protein SPK30_06145, partial [Candidatus Cryptobacteroides sp.]|nr:hypothetical protein [Bacteroidales bacterium]MDY5744222.1 hypothetical protein [Candidatus Cryptobacteroides sp.]
AQTWESMQRHRRYSEEWPACGMSWLTKAGTGCHEGGIILSKKPPEWRLSLPQQRSASDSILRCRKEKRPASSMVVWVQAGDKENKRLLLPNT